MTKLQRVSVYRAYLAQIGLPSRIDDYDDIEFVRKDPDGPERRYAIFVAEDDPEYVSISCHDYDEVGGPAMRSFWLELMEEVHEKGKVAKLSFAGDYISASCQLFVPSPEVGCQVLLRCVQTIEAIAACVRLKLYEKLKQS